MNLIAFALENDFIHVVPHGWGNGYVAIPEGHPCFKMDYDTIEEKYGPDVHGGLTFSDEAITGQPEETKGMWIVGFDTAHYEDNILRWPNEASILREANSLKEQLAAIN